MLLNYSILFVFLGAICWLFLPNYNPTWDFGLSLILFGLHRMGSNDRET